MAAERLPLRVHGLTQDYPVLSDCKLKPGHSISKKGRGQIRALRCAISVSQPLQKKKKKKMAQDDVNKPPQLGENIILNVNKRVTLFGYQSNKNTTLIINMNNSVDPFFPQ